MFLRHHSTFLKYGALLFLVPASALTVGGCAGKSEPGPTVTETTTVTVTSPSGTTPTGAATITSPDPGPVNMNQDIEGTANNIQENHTLWLFVVSKLNRFYPQGEPIKIDGDGTWNATARFGDPNTEQGEKFTLMVVMADSEASAEIDRYIKNCNATGDYPGMDGLPAGASSETEREYTRN